MSADAWTRFQLRWGLGQILALLALFAAFQLGMKGAPVIAATCVFVAVATIRPVWAGRVQDLMTRFVPKILLVIVFFDFITARGDVLPPLVRTLALLLTYRALEFRNPRQDRQLVLLALLLLLMTGTLTADLMFAFEMLVFVPVALFLLALAVADDRGPEILHNWRDTWRGFTWRAWLRRVRGRVDRRILAFGAALYVAFGIAAMILFWTLPRFEFGHQLPFMKLPAQRSLTGFSENVTFGSVVEIQEDFSVAMRVDAPPDAAGMRPYWRMMVLDEYVGNGFRQSEGARRALREITDSRLLNRGPTIPEGEPERVWTHFLEGGISRQLPVPGGFSEMRFTSRQNLRFNTAVQTVGLKETPANMLIFQLLEVSSEGAIPATPADLPLGQAEGAILVGARDPAPEYPLSTLAVPAENQEQAFLAAAVGAVRERLEGPETARSFATHATLWLQERRGYALRTQLGETEHPVIRWMRSGESGHCELYASGLVLLAREAGHPARLVTGFHGGIWNGFEDYFMVRNADAHAWVEVFDPASGWMRFDPTPGNTRMIQGDGGTALVPLSQPSQVDATFTAYLDSLRLLWYRNVVNFDHVDQKEMVAEAESILKGWIEEARASLHHGWVALTRLIRSPFDFGAYRELLPLLAWVLALVLTVWLVRRLWAEESKRLSPENRIRRRAGEWLQRLGPGAEWSAHEDVQRDLLALRYGRRDDWRDPPAVFKRARALQRHAPPSANAESGSLG